MDGDDGAGDVESVDEVDGRLGRKGSLGRGDSGDPVERVSRSSLSFIELVWSAEAEGEGRTHRPERLRTKLLGVRFNSSSSAMALAFVPSNGESLVVHLNDFFSSEPGPNVGPPCPRVCQPIDPPDARDGDVHPRYQSYPAGST